MAHFKILAFQNPEFKILADLKILAIQILEFKILDFQNTKFKLLADLKILAFQIPTSRFWPISRF